METNNSKKQCPNLPILVSQFWPTDVEVNEDSQLEVEEVEVFTYHKANFAALKNTLCFKPSWYIRNSSLTLRQKRAINRNTALVSRPPETYFQVMNQDAQEVSYNENESSQTDDEDENDNEIDDKGERHLAVAMLKLSRQAK